MSRLRLTPAALGDLSDIWDWTAGRWSESQAEIYTGELHAGMVRVAEDPRRGRDRADVADGYRSYAIGSLVVWFRLSDSDSVEVIRVLHQRMDPGLNL